tara:strand:+ start:894 stop:1076 length:183 start_codon:yes stop_codon:yes gene_type:complete
MNKIKVGDTVCVYDQKLKDFYGKSGKVKKFIHPCIYAVEFANGENGWFLLHQIQKGSSLT